MSRALRASQEGIKQIRKATKQGGYTQKALAEALEISRSVITVLLRGEAIARTNFEELCKFLELDWRDIRGEDGVSDDLDLLVQEVKQKIAADVTDRCGTMRVLDMTQPIDLDRIYTDVNIIKDVTGRRRIGYDEVMEDVNRVSHGDIESGLDAVEEFQKLVVWGKPGAGKTTFMKYLAMSCLGDRFHGELVPIFVQLRFYAAIKGEPSLQEYIWDEFEKRDVAGDVVKRLLKEGRTLILLDGLDEVKKEDDRRVKQDIDQFSRDWLKNRFAITCRIAAREYQFEKFTEVEVADFDDGQIETFVNNWFRERDESKAERLLEKLKENEPVKELAKSPLLLTLLCLVLDKTNNLPEKQYKLFKEGLDILVKIWDEKWRIERDFPKHFKGEQIYRNLSSEDKLDMIGKIAFNTFVKGKYFFQQEDLQRQIKDYICNLPEASADPEALRLDSEAVLKAIEHHHGLLVAQARNIYSFSHLTFQEYFAAREIKRKRDFETLIENISNPRWKEVFYLTAEMLGQSDDFLKLMKEKIDGMIANDEKLQAFLKWANQKTNSVEVTYETAAVRAFYAYVEARTLDLNIDLDSALKLDLTLDLKLDLARTLDLDLARTLDLDLDSALKLDIALARALDLARARVARTLDRALALKLKLDLDSALKLKLALKLALDLALDRVARALDLASELGDDVLRQALQALKSQLPIEIDRGDLYQYWEINGEEWRNELRQVCIDRRNIGHDWQFTKEQAELLNQYYEANLLLVQCMNRSDVSKPVREAIEATMLLPVQQKTDKQ